MKRPSVSICVPAYNEEATIEDVVHESIAVLSSVTNDYEVLVGDDGSSDRTLQIVQKLSKQYDRLRFFHHNNSGVAKTCWELYRMARTEYVAFFPGDGQVRPGECRKLLSGIATYDVVVGNRRIRRDPLLRLITARMWNMATRVLFGLKVQDVDSVKLYPTALIRAIDVISHSPFMETEILIKALELGYRVGNVDVSHHPRTSGKSSALRIGVVLSAGTDMFDYWRNQHRPRGAVNTSIRTR